mgnify:CR=1 FL=1
MKKINLTTALVLVALAMSSLAAHAAQFLTPKSEFRSAWVATVWCLDWPADASRGTGELNATKMKQQLVVLLDSLQRNNFNAVNLQVRSMCDAFYESSYEPWSSYISGTRGAAPAFDPLAFAVEEAHKRGMECHAWVNPYRFSTGSDWNTAQDQELKNNGWLLTYGSTIILDPAQQRTIDRIVNVCKEIITKYDVDGLLYDDYFYPDGIPSNSTAGDYSEWQDYQSGGGTLSMGDWRRENVNRMVASVYNMIQETRPEVRFGISPAGVAASSSSVASKYGVEPCPAGSDWQYNGIFSDPLAWMSSQTLDYMSPQIYWTTVNSSNPFVPIATWWNQMAQHFGRHMYVSHSISSLKRDSKGTAEPEPLSPYNNQYLYDEYANEIEYTRTTNLDGAPGSIFYSCKYLYNLGASEAMANFFKRTTYRYHALPPAMPWKTGNNPGLVKNLAQSGTDLTWEGYDNVRYTVYAFPRSMAHENFTKNVEYLLGISYGTTYAIPAKYQQEYQYAVCVLDRVGNEYDPVILGESYDPLDAPVLLTPADQSQTFAPFNFSWNAVENATSYTVEVAGDADFSSIIGSISTTATSISSREFDKMASEELHYWRVQASAQGWANGVSETRTVTPIMLEITSPYNGQKAVPTTDTITWNVPLHTTEATLVIADNAQMTSPVYTAKAVGGQHVLPEGAIKSGTKYYAQVSLVYNDELISSPVCEFTTLVSVPHFVVPSHSGASVYGTDYLSVNLQPEAVSYTIEVSNSETSWGRTRFIETVTQGSAVSKMASEMKVNSKLLVEGNTYYARAKAAYLENDGTNRSTDYCATVAFVYHATKPAFEPGDVNGDGSVDIQDVNIVINIILGTDAAEKYDGRADVNGDGAVDIQDVNAIINIILGSN